jgi:DNA-binding transcriptional LysR family regulator
MLDTNLVRAFIVVAQNLSFTRAAELLGTTQPLLSRAMRRLEDIVGEELIDRRKRQIALTPSGAAFLEEAQGILDHVGVALRRARSAGDGSLETLRIGYVPAIWLQNFHGGIRKFRRASPEIELDMRGMTSQQQTEALRAGEIDLGLTHLSNCDRRGLAWRVVGRNQLVLAIPSDWPVTPGRSIELASLRDRPFVLSDPEVAPELYAAHTAACRNAGFEPQVAAYARGSAELRFLVAAGFGVGFAYETALLTPVDGIRFMPMASVPEELQIESYVVWLPRRAPAHVQDFIDCMTSETYAAAVVLDGDEFGIEWRRASFDEAPRPEAYDR